MKKLLAMILCVVMMVSAFAVPASAADLITPFADSTYEFTEAVKPIAVCSNMGLIPGYVDGKFRPDGILTRGDIVKIAYKVITGDGLIEGVDVTTETNIKDVFEDVSKENDEELKKAIDYFIKEGVMKKYDNVNFNYNQPATIGEYAALFAKGLGFEEPNPDDPNYLYGPKGSFVALENAGILSYTNSNGYTDYYYDLAYDSVLTRDVAAQIIYNIIFDYPPLSFLVTSEKNPNEYSEPFGVLKYNINTMGTAIVLGTKNNPMGHKIENDVLLSNGADVKIAGDYDAYVGYRVVLSYADLDGSGVYSADEPIFYMEPSVTVSQTFYFNDDEVLNMFYIGKKGHFYEMSYGSYYAVAGNSTNRIYLTNGTKKFLNYNKWPENYAYNFDEIFNTASREDVASMETITNRPEMQITIVDMDGDMAIDYFYAFEYRLGKVLSNASGVIKFYDYYLDEITTYDVTTLKTDISVNVGDIVKYCDYGSELRVTEAKSVSGTLSDITASTLAIGETTLEKSVFFKDNGKAVPAGAEATVYYDGTGAIAVINAEDKGDDIFYIGGGDAEKLYGHSLVSGADVEVPLADASIALQNASYGIKRFNGSRYIYGAAESIYGTIVKADANTVDVLITEVVDSNNSYQKVVTLYKSAFCDDTVNNSVTNTATTSIATIYLDDAGCVIGITQ
ncbi:MAG: S-layer homology domain-containing protein [Clostridia bacterium]|nr:S-layer homology domain-containing protein [Clostridia bacterium]